MADLIPFENGEFRIEVDPTGDTFTVRAPGLSKALGFREAYDLMRSIPEDEKGSELVRTPGGDQRIGYVTEAGFYRALGQRQAARISDETIRDRVARFQTWVYGEVLPAIRKTGGYGNRELTRLELIDIARDAEVGRLAAEEKLAIAAPKADYVDSFVNGDTDATTIRVLANQLQIGEKALRTRLVAAKAIYQKLQGRRYSRTQGRMVAEYSWHAYATHKAWFVERDQPEAPRFHNGQVRTTLYVTPVGKVKIAALVARESEAS